MISITTVGNGDSSRPPKAPHLELQHTGLNLNLSEQESWRISSIFNSHDTFVSVGSVFLHCDLYSSIYILDLFLYE